MAIEAHRYFDADGTGRYQDLTIKGNGANADKAATDLRVWTRWLEQTGYQGWLGEFGVPTAGGANAEWMPILERVYQELDAHSNVIGGSLWVTGGQGVGDASSWKYNGAQAVPVGAADNAHWKVLSKYPTGTLR